MSQQASEPDMTGILETADQEFKNNYDQYAKHSNI